MSVSAPRARRVARLLAFACAAGALAASSLGAQPSLPTAAQLQALLALDA